MNKVRFKLDGWYVFDAYKFVVSSGLHTIGRAAWLVSMQHSIRLFFHCYAMICEATDLRVTDSMEECSRALLPHGMLSSCLRVQLTVT